MPLTFIGMKQLFLLLVLLFSAQSYSQDQKPEENHTIIDTAGLFNGEYIVLENVRFKLGLKSLDSTSCPILDSLVLFLENNPTLVIEVAQHMDCRGSDKSCIRLSQSRAESIVNYLINKGIDPSRLVAKGYGETKPIVLNGKKLTCNYINELPTRREQEEMHQLNRRVELIILANNYIPKAPKRKHEAPFRLNE